MSERSARSTRTFDETTVNDGSEAGMWSTEMLVLAARAGEVRGSGPIENAFDGWKDADAAARAIEREVNEAWSRYERGVGAPPSSALLREAACVRRAAREKLGEVMGLLRGAAAGAHDAPSVRPVLNS